MNTPAAPSGLPDAKGATPHQAVTVSVPCVQYSPDLIAIPWPEQTQGNGLVSWLITHDIAGRIPLLCADLRSVHHAMASLDISIARNAVDPTDPASVQGWRDWYVESRPQAIAVFALQEYQ